MKILHDFQIFFVQIRGGVSRYHIELTDELIKEGVETERFILFPINRYYNDRKRISNTIREKIYRKFVFSRFNRKLYLLNQKKTISRIRRKKYDIVHMTWTDPYLFDAGIEITKIVVTIHDMIHELLLDRSEDIKDEIYRKKRAIFESDGIIAISENTKADILRLYPDINEKKIRVIYHGTNHLPKPLKNEQIEDMGKYLLYVGVRDAYKRGMWFAKEVSGLLQEKDLKLLFVGGRSFSDEETDLINKCGIADRVLQLDLSDGELAYAYRNAVCFVYPTLYEGFGFPILEAFDNGCPVVCTRSSSLPEVGGDAAVYFDADDADTMREKISVFCDEPSVREMCVKKGFDRTKNFTWEKTAEETADFYREVLTGFTNEERNKC